MIRCFVILIEILLMFLLQSSVFPSFALAGVVPDLLLILIVTCGFIYGKTAGLLTGFFCGLLVDFSFSSFLGLFAMIYMAIGYLAGYSNKIYDRDDYTLPLILVGVGELLYNFLYFLFMFLLRGRLNLGYYFFRFMIPKVIYTVLVSIVLYKLFQMIFHGLEHLRKGEK